MNADRGSAAIMGANVQSQFRDARRMLGVVPQELVFDPFFTDRKNGVGTGLGLSVCHSIIKEHNGKINVKSFNGKTKFIISLPLIETPK